MPVAVGTIKAGAGKTFRWLATQGITGNPLGINLNGVSYFSPEQPFLNIVKQCGVANGVGSDAWCAWSTAKTGTFNTGEIAYLAPYLDGDGYCKTLSIPGIPGGQQFTYLSTNIFIGMTKPPGASDYYPAGTYRIKFIGKGTLQITGDATATFTNSASSTYFTGTFSVAAPSATGLHLNVTAITDNADYPRDISIVQNSLASSYDGGQYFHPNFLQAMQNFSCFRFMDWGQTNNEFRDKLLNTSGHVTIAAGATSCTLENAWPYPSDTLTTIFWTGDVKDVTYTLGSQAATWTGGLARSVPYTASYNGQLNISWRQDYTIRSTPTRVSWSGVQGVPTEVCANLCTTLNADAWANVPIMYDDAAVTSMVTLWKNSLGSSSLFHVELSNEVWNSGFKQEKIVAALGQGTWPSASGGAETSWRDNWFGMRTAQIATLAQTAWGADFGRCTPTLGAFASSTFIATDSLQTSFWNSGPASSYPIKAIAIAPYWGSYPSQADVNTMIALSDGGLQDFFDTLTSRTGSSGNTYSSIPSNGWLGQAEARIDSHVAIMSSYPTMKLVAYEGGQNFLLGGAIPTGWQTLATAANRDSRMGTAYTNYLNYWATHVGSGDDNIHCVFQDINPIGVGGAWGALEHVMQTTLPISSSPAKYKALQNYMGFF